MSEIDTSRNEAGDMGHTSEQTDPACCPIVELRQYTLKPGRCDELITLFEFFETQIIPVLGAAGAALLGYYVTEPAENTFPQLPVRADEHVFVWFASFADEQAYAVYQAALTASQVWITSLAPTLQRWLAGPEEVLELAPTRRSLVRHRTEEQRAGIGAP